MTNVFWWIFVCTFTYGRYHADSAQILAMLPFPSKSHWNVMDTVLQTLVTRGHNVTAITPFIKNMPIANYTEMDISWLSPLGIGVPWKNIMNKASEANNLPFLSSRHQHTCKKVFEHDKFWHVLKSNKYDLFITELLASSCDAYVSYYLQVPQIVIVSSHVHTWYHHTFGSHMNPAYLSTYHAPFASPKNFMQRMANAYDYLYSHIVFKWVDREATAIGRKYFGSDAPDADTLMKNTSLMFINGHYTVDLVKPMLPNFIDIGGIHLVQPKPLSQDIEQFINDSPNGVIYFTFGSTMKMDTIPEYLQTAFIEALGELPQRVLWKYENQSLGIMPENVKIGKWFPQRDILEHKNVKLFITHGGMSGIYEVIDSGVPVLGIPLFFDQPHNIANLVHWGAGVMLDYKTLTKEILVNTIKEMMTNYIKYKSKAMELSRRFKDRPKTPKEEIIYWTEYVINHKGGHHLKSSGIKLPWYQYGIIDVLSVVVFILSIILYFMLFLLKNIKYMMFRLTNQKKKKQTNKIT